MVTPLFSKQPLKLTGDRQTRVEIMTPAYRRFLSYPFCADSISITYRYVVAVLQVRQMISWRRLSEKYETALSKASATMAQRIFLNRRKRLDDPTIFEGDHQDAHDERLPARFVLYGLAVFTDELFRQSAGRKSLVSLKLISHFRSMLGMPSSRPGSTLFVWWKILILVLWRSAVQTAPLLRCSM